VANAEPLGASSWTRCERRLRFMARVFHLQHHPNGPRVWICGQRVHHGAVGVIAAAACAATRHPAGIAIAAALVVHDAHDLPIWFAREGLPL
jgi:hypothetical protein